MKKLIVFGGIFFVLNLMSCEKKPCYCNELGEDIPNHFLPSELKEYFTFPADSIIYIMRDTATFKQIVLELDYQEIGGGGGACGPTCIALDYRCECRDLEFRSDSLSTEFRLKINPRKELTSFDFFGYFFPSSFIDYHSKEDIRSGDMIVEFHENVTIGGKVYDELFVINDHGTIHGNVIWFAPNIGPVKLKTRIRGNYYHFELARFEIIE